MVFCSFLDACEGGSDIWRQMAATDDEGAIWRRHGLRGQVLGFTLFAGFWMSWHAFDLVHCCKEDEDGTGEVLGLLAHSSSIANPSLQDPSDSSGGSDIRGLAFIRTFWKSLRSPYNLASLTGNAESVVSSIGHPKWLTFGCSSHGGPVSRDRRDITSILR